MPTIKGRKENVALAIYLFLKRCGGLPNNMRGKVVAAPISFDLKRSTTLSVNNSKRQTHGTFQDWAQNIVNGIDG